MRTLEGSGRESPWRGLWKYQDVIHLGGGLQSPRVVVVDVNVSASLNEPPLRTTIIGPQFSIDLF